MSKTYKMGDWLELFIKYDGYFQTHYDYEFNVIIPKDFDKKLPTFVPVDNGYEALTIRDIYDYFVVFERKREYDGDCICMINGHLTNPSYALATCNFCKATSDNNPGTWMYNNLFFGTEMCEKCIKTNGDRMKEKYPKGWVFRDFPGEKIPDYNFGSILDWIPIMRHNEDSETLDYLLFNTNKKSKYYHTVALMCEDDHGRRGCFCVKGTLEEVLERLRSKTEKVKEIWEKGENSDGCESDYNGYDYLCSEIKLVLVEDGHQINYG